MAWSDCHPNQQNDRFNMKNTISLAGRAALLFCLALLSAHAFADRDDNEISRFIQSQDNNPGPGIGKTLPEDLVVLNSAGERSEERRVGKRGERRGRRDSEEKKRAER